MTIAVDMGRKATKTNKIMKLRINVFSADIEEQVIHVILELASPDSLDDYRTEAVAVSK